MSRLWVRLILLGLALGWSVTYAVIGPIEVLRLINAASAGFVTAVILINVGRR